MDAKRTNKSGLKNLFISPPKGKYNAFLFLFVQQFEVNERKVSITVPKRKAV
jgi:hypothetical protein